ncbi:AAA family ATPase [Actinomadura sp. NAK00032]|uniref:DnaB-like helicase C-terminal domain-containing protein n=1 Tax=Actinomadura sp. NAK00032 TaxID=2742128 RepID=UPI0015913489|nr:DnaB-like helicase C-terminal domain-containing protein [Actinomadura sp. NAK00032]QKW35017.1 AAA family ATPase [Actinomadura sp. NAK00032]
MAKVNRPVLPDGPIREFFDALHQLHLAAGRPSMRNIQISIGRDVLSHTTIHKALRGPKVPSWGAIELIVEVLADKAKKNQPTTIEYFRQLWARAEGWSVDDHAQKERQHPPKDASARPILDFLLGALDEIEGTSAPEGTSRTILTGIDGLDDLTGGLRPGSLNIIASRVSVGKTAVTSTIGRSLAIERSISTAFFSLEESENEFQMRLLSAQGGVPFRQIRASQLKDEEWTRLARTMTDIASAPLWLMHSSTLNLRLFKQEIERLKSEHDLKVAIIDSLSPMVAASIEDGSAQDMADALRQLKRIGSEHRIVIIATARIKESSATYPTEPELADLKDGDDILNEADMVALLHRPDLYYFEDRPGEMDFRIMKYRHGPRYAFTVALQGHYMRILNLPRGWPNNMKDASEEESAATNEGNYGSLRHPDDSEVDKQGSSE